MSYTNFKINIYEGSTAEPAAVFTLPYEAYLVNVGVTTGTVAQQDYYSTQIVYPNYDISSQVKAIYNTIKNADVDNKKFIEIFLLNDINDTELPLLEKSKISYKAYDLSNLKEDTLSDPMVLRELLKIESVVAI